jgi:hypothetical protein
LVEVDSSILKARRSLTEYRAHAPFLVREINQRLRPPKELKSLALGFCRTGMTNADRFFEATSSVATTVDLWVAFEAAGAPRMHWSILKCGKK